MGKIITLLNVKGGVGKTTTAINLAGAIGKQKHKVLVIDNDSQSNVTQILNVTSKYTLYDLYTNPKVNFQDCISQYNNYIYVIPNVINSSMLESQLHNKMSRESILKNKYAKFPNDFDFILIDNSPFLGITVQNSLVLSDYYMEIIDNSVSALQGLNMVKKITDEIKESSLNEDLKLLGILRNRFEKRTIFNKQFDEVVQEELKDKLLKTIIYDSVKYKEATALHKVIQDYSSFHGKPYIELYYEIIKKLSAK
jgi:chromosome partitioning protein